MLVEETDTIAEVKIMLSLMFIEKYYAIVDIPLEMVSLFRTPHDDMIELENDKDLSDYHVDSCFCELVVFKLAQLYAHSKPGLGGLDVVRSQARPHVCIVGLALGAATMSCCCCCIVGLGIL